MTWFAAIIQMPCWTLRKRALEIYLLSAYSHFAHTMQTMALAAAKHVTMPTFSAIPLHQQH
jgi:hypothetical protein